MLRAAVAAARCGAANLGSGCSCERERRYGQYDHVRLCGSDYLERLEEPGFAVTREDYAERLNLATRSLYEIHAGEPFYVCVKPPA